jgi:hypothetical protein
MIAMEYRIKGSKTGPGNRGEDSLGNKNKIYTFGSTYMRCWKWPSVVLSCKQIYKVTTMH